MKRDCTCPRARHQHGTRAAYIRDGCRCFECRIAASRVLQAWRREGQGSEAGMWVPACGVIRRLEALHRLGWTTGDLAARLGITSDGLRSARTYHSPRRSAALAARIAELYDDLWNQQPIPRGRGHAAMISKTRATAIRLGWAPPLAWDDDEIDNPAAEPYRDTINHGTRGGYATHRYHGEQPCQPCRTAEADYQRARREKAA